jgi:hypothetical protein
MMRAAPRVRCWHGPRREPLAAADDAAPTRVAGAFAYFGIMARGLVRRLSEAGNAGRPLDARDWARVAPLLDREGALAAEPCLRLWEEAAQRSGVLTVSDSAELCKAAALELGHELTGSLEALDLWLVKEGHTASVWRAEMVGRSGSAVVAVNVARDDEAGEELRSSYHQMCTWHQSDPEHVAAPLQIERRSVDPGTRRATAVVSAHVWVPGRELHARPRADAGGRAGDAEFIEIESFLPDPHTGRIEALARVLEPTEQAAVWERLIAFLGRHRRVDEVGCSTLPGVNVNDGDFVYHQRELVAVAANASPWSVSAEEWHAFLSAPYVEWRPDGPRLARPRSVPI